jgi:hypothetical protein
LNSNDASIFNQKTTPNIIEMSQGEIPNVVEKIPQESSNDLKEEILPNISKKRDIGDTSTSVPKNSQETTIVDGVEENEEQKPNTFNELKKETNQIIGEDPKQE